MRQERSTSVTIDLRVGSIELPEGSVMIPAELELKEPGGGAGGADMSKLLGKVGAILGPGATRELTRVLNVFRTAIPALGRIAGLLGGIGVAVYALTLPWKALNWVVAKGMAVLKTLVNVLRTVVGWMWRLNAATMRFLAIPLRAVIGRTVNVLGLFVGKLQEAGRWLLQIAQDYVRKAVDTFQNFEQQVANTVSVMGRFGDAADMMREKVGAAMIEITRYSRFMASEAAQAGYNIASAGFSELQQVVDMTAGSIILAEATLSTLNRTAEIMVATMNQFGLAASDASRVANVFAAAISMSPATMTKLGQALEYAGPIANSFAISMEQAVAAVMALFKQGRSGSRAGTELRIVLASMAKATDKMRTVMGEFGITMEQLSPARVGIVGMIEVFERLRDTIGQIGTVEAIYQAFPVRAASALVALMQVGSVEVTRMQKAITGTNTAFKMQQDQLRTLQGAWKIFLSKAEELRYQFLERLSPALVSVVKQLQGLVDWARESGVFKQAGGLLGEGLTAAVNLIRSLAAPAFEMLKHAAETLVPVIQELAAVVGPLLGKWIETVFPLLVAIFAQLGRVLTTFLEQNGDAIIDWFKLFLETGLKIANWLPNVLPFLKSLVDLFMAWAPVLADAVVKYLPELLKLFEKLPGAVDQFLKVYIPLLLKGFDNFLGLLQKAVDDLVPKLLELFEGLGPDIGKTLDDMTLRMAEFMESIEDLVSNIELLRGAGDNE
jgi:TP901 family phage tail tape measure protein